LFHGGFWYDGGNYKFEASADLRWLIGTVSGWSGKRDSKNNPIDFASNGFWGHAGRLWGYYKLLNEIVHLEVAYNSRDTQFWYSDTTGAFWGTGGKGSPIAEVSPYNPWGTYVFGGGDSFTVADHNNYLLGNIQLSGIAFGLMAPSLFLDEKVHWDNAGSKGVKSVDAKGFPKALNGKTAYSLVDGVLKQMIFGLKFEMSPVEVAVQFLMKDFGVYFGGRWWVGPVTVGLSFMGILDARDEKTGDKIPGARDMKVGAKVEYNADAFGAYIKGFYGLTGNTLATNSGQVGVEPGFFFNVIPSHLQFVTDIGFYFTNVYHGADLDPDASSVTWAVRPQLFWNFLGTGAGGYYSMGTGMLFRYVIVSDAINALDITFKFSF